MNDALNGHTTIPPAPSVIDISSDTAIALPRQRRKVYFIGDIGSGYTKTAMHYEGDPYSHQKEKVKADPARGTRKGHRTISAEAIALIEQLLITLQPSMDLLPDEDVRLYATSALREAIEESGIPPDDHPIMKRLSAAAGGRRIRILSGKEEAGYIKEAIEDEIIRLAIPQTDDEKPVEAEEKTMAFAAMGGGSVQFGRVGVDEANAGLISIPYGIQPLITESDGNIKNIPKVLNPELAFINYGEIDTLYVAGGNWRDLSEIIKKKKKGITPGQPEDLVPVELSFKQAKRALKKIIAMKPRRYNKLAPKDRKREELMTGAKALLEIMKHFKAEKIVFSNATIRQAVAKDHNFHGIDGPRYEPPLPSIATALLVKELIRASHSHYT